MGMWPFLSQGWNLFDAFVVTIGVVDLTGLKYPQPLRMVRLFRAFRVFRLFGRIESLRKIIVSVKHALPGVANALILGLIMISIYSVLAVDLFWNLYDEDCKEPSPPYGSVTARGNCYGDEYYGTFFAAQYTLFQILTGESWSEAGVRPILHYYRYVSNDAVSTIGVGVFLVSFIVITSFVLLNVVVAVLLD